MTHSIQVVIRCSAVAALLMLMLACTAGEEVLVPIGPSPGEHVLSLAVDDDGTLYAGAASGQVWAYLGQADWRPVGEPPAGSGITALAAQPRLTVAGALGAWAWGAGEWHGLHDGLPDAYRATALLPLAEGGLMLATESAIYASANGLDDWQAVALSGLPEGVQIYRLGLAADGTLMAGTIGQGLWRRQAGTWRPDGEGLPAPLNVFSFLPLPDGGMAIGTDRGPYHRNGSAGRWEPLGWGLQGQRVIALAATEGRAGRLFWAGGDLGVHTLSGPGEPWQAVTAAVAPRAAVAWLLGDGTHLYAAAGRVYRVSGSR